MYTHPDPLLRGVQAVCFKTDRKIRFNVVLARMVRFEESGELLWLWWCWWCWSFTLSTSPFDVMTVVSENNSVKNCEMRRDWGSELR